MTGVEELKIILREVDCPFFTQEEFEYYLGKNGDDVNKTAYQMLLVKAENSELNVSGLTTADSSTYFRRLAKRYRPRNSGTLGGVY